MKAKRSAEHLAAVALLFEIEERTGKQLAMRAVPKPRYVSRRQLDAERAMRMIEGEMVESLKRCAELERDL